MPTRATIRINSADGTRIPTNPSSLLTWIGVAAKFWRSSFNNMAQRTDKLWWYRAFASVRCVIVLAVVVVVLLNGSTAFACNLCGCCRTDTVIASGSAIGDIIISEILYDADGSDTTPGN